MSSKIQEIQTILGVKADGIFGPKSQAALERAIEDARPSSHTVKASSFADPADVAAFRKCKAQGGSDQHCFGLGDNGIGFTGIDCSRDDMLYCALPPEDWRPKWGPSDSAAGREVRITFEGKTVIAALGDTMPHRENIHNGAGIDMNPGLCKALGLTPPVMVDGVTWEWV